MFQVCPKVEGNLYELEWVETKMWIGWIGVGKRCPRLPAQESSGLCGLDYVDCGLKIGLVTVL
jgi:hypothetical protein